MTSTAPAPYAPLQLNRFQAANDANEREQEGYAAKQEQLEAQIRQVGPRAPLGPALGAVAIEAWQ